MFRKLIAAVFALAITAGAAVSQGVIPQPLKLSVDVATTANITLSGAQTIDGVSVTAGMRVLAKNQSTASQNGPWVVQSGAWTRPVDYNQPAQAVTGTMVQVIGGLTQAGRLYALSTSGAIVPGTTSTTWEPMFGAEGGLNVWRAGTNVSTGGCTLEDCLPDYSVHGSGTITSSAAAGYGGTYTKLAPEIYLRSSAMYFTPTAPTHVEWLNGNEPAVGRHGNTIFGAGGPTYASSGVSRTTVFGSLAGANLTTSTRCEMIGEGNHRFAKYCERTTAVGTENMVWSGQNLTSDPSGTYYGHTLWWNAGTPITDLAWDYDGLETQAPGIRATIAGWVNWAASTGHVESNVMIGRDAGNAALRTRYNSGVGYRACGLLVEGDYNTCMGYESLFHNILGTGNTAFGKSSGDKNQQGNFNSYFGYNAGSGLISGSSNIIMGVNAGFNTCDNPANCWTGSSNIFIGNSAGRGLTGTVSNRLIINNQNPQSALVWGELDTHKITLGLADETPLATLHVKTANSGATPASATGIFLENSAGTEITIATGIASIGALNFADSGGSARGFVNYDHATDALSLGAGATEGVSLTSTAVSFALTAVPRTNDGAALGTTALQWSDVFLASGAVINFANGDVTVTHSSNTLAFAGASSGYTFDAAVTATSNDAAALGSATVSWSDLFLASGGVINWNNGDVTATHAVNALSFAGASNGYTFDAAVQPSANDGAALGSATVSWSDLFLASGGVINWNNGAYTLTQASGLLTASGQLAVTGTVGIQTANVTGTILAAGGNVTGATTAAALHFTPTAQSDVTSALRGIRTDISTAAAAFTLTSIVHLDMNQDTIGAGSSVTNQFGVLCRSSMSGATNNYCFYGQLAEASGRWNLFMTGTAANYIAGKVHTSTSGLKPALSSCGGGSPTNSGSDRAGTVTTGTAATTCTVTFASAYSAAPTCVVTWRNTPAATQTYSVSTTAISITQTAAVTTFDYVCTGLGT